MNFSDNSGFILLNKKRDIPAIEALEENKKKDNITINNQITIDQDGKIIEIEPKNKTILPELPQKSLYNNFVRAEHPLESMMEQIVRPYEFSPETGSIKFKFTFTGIVEWDGLTINFQIDNPNPVNYLQLDGTLDSLISEIYFIIDESNTIEHIQKYNEKSSFSNLLRPDNKNENLYKGSREILLDPKTIGTNVIFNPSEMYLPLKKEKIREGKFDLLESGSISVSIPIRASLLGNLTWFNDEKGISLKDLRNKQVAIIIKFNPNAFFVPIFESSILNLTKKAIRGTMVAKYKNHLETLKRLRKIDVNKKYFNRAKWTPIFEVDSNGNDILKMGDSGITTKELLKHVIKKFPKIYAISNNDKDKIIPIPININHIVILNTGTDGVNYFNSADPTDQNKFYYDQIKTNAFYFDSSSLSNELISISIDGIKTFTENGKYIEEGFFNDVDENLNKRALDDFMKKENEIKECFFYSIPNISEKKYKYYLIGSYTINGFKEKINFSNGRTIIGIYNNYYFATPYIVTADGKSLGNCTKLQYLNFLKKYFSITSMILPPISNSLKTYGAVLNFVENVGIVRVQNAEYLMKEFIDVFNDNIINSDFSRALKNIILNEPDNANYITITELFLCACIESKFQLRNPNLIISHVKNISNVFDDVGSSIVKNAKLGKIIEFSEIEEIGKNGIFNDNGIENIMLKNSIHFLWDYFGKIENIDFKNISKTKFLRNKIIDKISTKNYEYNNNVDYYYKIFSGIDINNQYNNSLIEKYKKNIGINFVKRAYNFFRKIANFSFSLNTVSFIAQIFSISTAKLMLLQEQDNTKKFISSDLFVKSLNCQKLINELLLNQTDELSTKLCLLFELLFEEYLLSALDIAKKKETEIQRFYIRCLKSFSTETDIKLCLILSEFVILESFKNASYPKENICLLITKIIKNNPSLLVNGLSAEKNMERFNIFYTNEEIDKIIKENEEEIKKNFTNQDWQSAFEIEIMKDSCENSINDLINNDGISRTYHMIDPYIAIKYKPLEYIPIDIDVWQPKIVEHYTFDFDQTSKSISLLTSDIQDKKIILFFKSNSLLDIPTYRHSSLKNIPIKNMTIVLNGKHIYKIQNDLFDSTNSDENYSYIRDLAECLPVPLENTRINKLNYSIGETTTSFISKLLDGQKARSFINDALNLNNIYVNMKFGYFNEILSSFMLGLNMQSFRSELNEEIQSIEILYSNIEEVSEAIGLEKLKGYIYYID